MTGLDHALAVNTWIDPVREGTLQYCTQVESDAIANGPSLAMLFAGTICAPIVSWDTIVFHHCEDSKHSNKRRRLPVSAPACTIQERLGVCGGSYGGFMTMWIATQTQRFKAAVSHAGLSNHISFYGTSMYLPYYI